MQLDKNKSDTIVKRLEKTMLQIKKAGLFAINCKIEVQ